MLKWIVILLKALTIVPAVVSMKTSDRLVATWEDTAKKWESTADVNNKGWNRAEEQTQNATEHVNRLSEEKQNLQLIIDHGSNYKLCSCRGCKVLRSLTHGYADRMRGAIRRDIEAESA